MNTADLIIIGGGQAGLATAHEALTRGQQPVVLDASGAPGGSWPKYYDSLKLYSPARYSALPGVPFPGDPNRYPSRDETIAYLADYADRLDAQVCQNERAHAVTTDRDGFLVKTSRGGEFRAPGVVIATGSFGKPWTPAIPGMETFAGRILHSADYRRPDDFDGDRIVVVGGGNSAVQIAVELAQTAKVSIATRRPLRWQQQRILGRDFHWWLDRTGLDRARSGLLLAKNGTPVVDDGGYRYAVRAGRPDARGMFTRFTDHGVIWADGSSESVDAIILATGFRPDVSFLPVAALNSSGIPLHTRGVSITVPGLGYAGLERQRMFASATLRGVGPDARHVLDALGTFRNVSGMRGMEQPAGVDG
ncbi:flavin-containing monooxygenase [Arthrobacter sp. SA17]